MNAAMTTSERTLRSLIKDIKFAMFTTVGQNGLLNSRPLTTQDSNEAETDLLWFFVPKHSEVAEEIAANNMVGITYAEPKSETYISVTGSAALVDDAAKKKALWSPMVEAWFPNGPDDPNLGLLRVKALRAHYWDVKQNKLVRLYEMSKAYIIGAPPKDMGDSVEVRIR